MRKFRTRLALAIAPWLKPSVYPVTYTTGTINPVKVYWTDPPTFGPSNVAR